jgi:hypothetical protein
MYASRRRFVEWMTVRDRRAGLSRPAPAVERAAYPYRTRLGSPPDGARPEVYYVELFAALRSEVATAYNGGCPRFLPMEERSFEEYSNGDNASAAVRWGLGL